MVSETSVGLLENQSYNKIDAENSEIKYRDLESDTTETCADYIRNFLENFEKQNNDFTRDFRNKLSETLGNKNPDPV